MTSYNLVNGVHTSESAELLEAILREEWGYEGLVMTDWVVRFMTRTDLKHPRAAAGASVAAGNELFMPGCEEDRQDVLAALAGGSESGAVVPSRISLALMPTRNVVLSEHHHHFVEELVQSGRYYEIGRASCRERV